MNEILTPVSKIEEWLTGRVATYGDLEPETFTVDTPLTELGFNSVYALTLCGDIEDTYGYEADPSLVWDHGNIRDLAHALSVVLASR